MKANLTQKGGFNDCDNQNRFFKVILNNWLALFAVTALITDLSDLFTKILQAKR